MIGEGDPHAQVLFVGEAPGLHDDAQGDPLAGPAGELFGELLGSIGLTRASCYVTSLVKCRPPRNRQPEPVELEACRPKLCAQIEAVAPTLVCSLGDGATRALSGPAHGVAREHGRVRRAQVGGIAITLYPLYHPASVLFNLRLRPELEADVLRIPEILRLLVAGGDLGSVEPPPPLPPAAAASLVAGEEPEQLGLF